MEVSAQLYVKALLSPGIELLYQFYVRLGGPQSRSGRYGGGEYFTSVGSRTPAFQPIGRCYTD
jgi:hypothetical protein